MNLEELYEKVDKCTLCKKEENVLQHIHGVGKTKNPKWMLVLINPTHRNISTLPGYKGQRFPFIGVSDFWKALNQANLISENLIEKIKNKDWSNTTKEQIRKELDKKSIYITNLVKCSANHPEYPSKERIKKQYKLFEEEVEIINPKKIVSFGLLPFEKLTGAKIKLKEYWENKSPQSFRASIRNKTYPIIPCYFPVGRGNPKKAIEVLKIIREK